MQPAPARAAKALVPETDYFALLNQPRRPWLDPQVIQAEFLRLSSNLHPDRVHQASPDEKTRATDRFASLNAACNCLQKPKERLRHLLELERGHKPAQLESLSSNAADFYFQLGQVCREADQFLGDKNSAASPLFQARYFERALAWRQQLEEFQQRLAQRRLELEEETKKLNIAWEAAPVIGDSSRPAALPLEQLEQLYRELSYIARWAEQVRERVLQLSF